MRNMASSADCGVDNARYATREAIRIDSWDRPLSLDANDSLHCDANVMKEDSVDFTNFDEHNAAK